MSKTQNVEGRFEHLIYSPRGDIEGVLLKADAGPLQIVFDRHDATAAQPFMVLQPGDTVRLQAPAEPPSDKGEAMHPVHRFEQLLSVNGHAPAASGEEGPPYSGTVARLNYARHGEPNGVVLGNGYFIHTRPHGMAALQLKPGDAVQADGEARPLVTGQGWVVEATVVNGTAL